jgi:hypothetical protein
MSLNILAVIISAILVSACALPFGEPAPVMVNPDSARCDTSSMRVLNYTVTREAGNHLRVIGELQNGSSEDLILAAVCINFIGRDRVFVERRYAGPLLVKGHEVVPFRTVIDNPSNGDDIRITVSTTAQSGRSEPNLVASTYRELQVGQVVPSVRLDQALLIINGIVTNTGSYAVNNIYVSVGLYDDDHKLLDVADGKVTTLVTLLPDEAMSFTFTMTNSIVALSRVTVQSFAEGLVVDNDFKVSR